MAETGTDGATDRAWRAAVLLGLALIAGALALAYPMVFGPCPCRDPDGRLILVTATSRDLWIAVEAARYVASGASASSSGLISWGISRNAAPTESRWK
jgi:hypothetical protein